jgi:hypothetical protein
MNIVNSPYAVPSPEHSAKISRIEKVMWAVVIANAVQAILLLCVLFMLR